MESIPFRGNREARAQKGTPPKTTQKGKKMSIRRHKQSLNEGGGFFLVKSRHRQDMLTIRVNSSQRKRMVSRPLIKVALSPKNIKRLTHVKSTELPRSLHFIEVSP